MAIIDLDKLNPRTRTVIKGVINKLIVSDEPKGVQKEIHEIQDLLTSVDPSLVDAIMIPKACTSWSGPIEQIKVLQVNKKRK